jgi:hypothetical protein
MGLISFYKTLEGGYERLKGMPLYKQRFTKTVAYQLTSEEKNFMTK